MGERRDPQGDLAHTLARSPATGGFLFDRLEDAVRGNLNNPQHHAVATVCLKKRSLPEKPPPRLIVFTGGGWVLGGRVLGQGHAEALRLAT